MRAAAILTGTLLLTLGLPGEARERGLPLPTNQPEPRPPTPEPQPEQTQEEVYDIHEGSRAGKQVGRVVIRSGEEVEVRHRRTFMKIKVRKDMVYTGKIVHRYGERLEIDLPWPTYRGVKGRLAAVFRGRNPLKNQHEVKRVRMEGTLLRGYSGFYWGKVFHWVPVRSARVEMRVSGPAQGWFEVRYQQPGGGGYWERPSTQLRDRYPGPGEPWALEVPLGVTIRIEAHGNADARFDGLRVDQGPIQRRREQILLKVTGPHQVRATYSYSYLVAALRRSIAALMTSCADASSTAWDVRRHARMVAMLFEIQRARLYEPVSQVVRTLRKDGRNTRKHRAGIIHRVGGWVARPGGTLALVQAYPERRTWRDRVRKAVLEVFRASWSVPDLRLDSIWSYQGLKDSFYFSPFREQLFTQEMQIYAAAAELRRQQPLSRTIVSLLDDLAKQTRQEWEVDTRINEWILSGSPPPTSIK